MKMSALQIGRKISCDQSVKLNEAEKPHWWLTNNERRISMCIILICIYSFWFHNSKMLFSGSTPPLWKCITHILPQNSKSKTRYAGNGVTCCRSPKIWISGSHAEWRHERRYNGSCSESYENSGKCLSQIGKRKSDWLFWNSLYGNLCNSSECARRKSMYDTKETLKSLLKITILKVSIVHKLVIVCGRTRFFLFDFR